MSSGPQQEKQFDYATVYLKKENPVGSIVNGTEDVPFHPGLPSNTFEKLFVGGFDVVAAVDEAPVVVLGGA